MNALLTLWPYILTAVVALFGAWRIFAAGQNREKAKQVMREAKARTIADEIDDAVAGRTAEENRKRLGTWAKR